MVPSRVNRVTLGALSAKLVAQWEIPLTGEVTVRYLETILPDSL